MTPDTTTSPFTTLPGQTQCHLTRAVCTPVSTILQEFSPQGLCQVTLTTEQLQAFLKALPRETLLEALGANPFLALDELDPCPATCIECVWEREHLSPCVCPTEGRDACENYRTELERLHGHTEVRHDHR